MRYTFRSTVTDQYGNEEYGEITFKSKAEAEAMVHETGLELAELGWEWDEESGLWVQGAETVKLEVTDES